MRTAVYPFLALSFVCGLLLGAGDPAWSADKKTLAYSDNVYPILDPAHASVSRQNDERLILALLDCLTVLDPVTGKAGPGAAERWDVSDDRRTWTFHLRPSAVWSDGSPVTAKDFVRAWTHIMDPSTAKPWTPLFRPIKGCAVITDNSARTQCFADLRNGLGELKRANPNGIPGDRLISLLEDTGVRPFLHSVRSRSIQRMLKWKAGDLYPPEMVDKAIEALKKERREVKDLWEDEFARFGKSDSGIFAQDDHTLIVKTIGDAPYLPELLARSAFSPLHAAAEAERAKFFEPENYVTNGPFILKGRGARPPENQPEKRVLSLVHLVKSKTYNGPSPAQVDELFCYTDQGQDFKEDIRLYKAGKRQWVNTTWQDGVPSKPKTLREEIEALEGYIVRDVPVVLYLLFRCDKPPFKEKAARKAFALSVDREAVAAKFWPNARPATRIVPPGIDGRREGLQGPAPDLGAAKAAVKESGMDSETWVELSYGETFGDDDVARTLIGEWKKALAIEPGTRIESDLDRQKVIRSGNFWAMLARVRGAFNDPYAYLGPLHSDNVDSGHGWRDEATDALLEAARDPDTALSDADGWLKKVGRPELSGALAAAKGSQEGRARLRQEALAAAEQRLMDEFVVVPLLYLREAVLVNGVTGLGEDTARNNPGFVGSLRSATR